MAILIDRCASEPNLSVSVVSESMPHLKRGAFRDFMMIMKETGRFIDKHLNKTTSTYTFHNGSYIEFFGADQPSKLRGARRKVLYINEANNIDYESYQELSIRTLDKIYMDFNPVNSFWAHTEVAKDPDSEMITINYLDNEALDDNVIKEFEIAKQKAITSEYWSNWVKVYVDGEIGSLEGAVFQNWTTIKEIPENARLIGLGLDFGFTNDPTAIVAVYYLDGELLIDELVYETGLTNPQIAKKIKQLGYEKAEVWCDSAEPKSIKELKNLGIRANGVVKGKDSVTWGISVVQQFLLKVTQYSSNLIDEFENYIWLKSKGKTTNIPADAYNHLMDAMRYLIMTKYGKKNKTKPSIRIV